MTFDYIVPPSAKIATSQNDVRALQLLIAQRRLYSRAKRWQGTRWIGVLILGVGAPFISLLTPPAAVSIGALTGAWLFIGRTVLTWLEVRIMTRAACLQEQFDQYVFEMPITIERTELPTPEEVSKLVGPGTDVAAVARKEQLFDWYPINHADPGPVAIAVAQRSNAAYTGSLIQTALIVWSSVALIWLTTLVVWAAVSGMTLASFLLGALFPVLPAVLDVSEYIAHTRDAARNRSDTARAIARRLSNADAIDGQQLLVWQERLFDLRRTTPQVPDWLYWATRRRNEAAMHAAAEELGARRTDNEG